jgi:hypothetical protein
MSQEEPEGAEKIGADESPAWQQLLLDDVFMLLMAGLVVPTLLYIVWGLMELSNVPVFTP